MDNENLDFVAFDSIDQSVDAAYTAYLDAVVMDRAAKNEDAKDYWDEIKEFRLGLYDPPKEDPDAVTPQSVTDDRSSVASYSRDFLYWYDLRAEYWWDRKSSDRAHFDTIVSPDVMREVLEVFRALQERLKTARPFKHLRHRASEASAPRAGVYAAPKPSSGNSLEESVVANVCAELEKRIEGKAKRESKQ